MHMLLNQDSKSLMIVYSIDLNNCGNSNTKQNLSLDLNTLAKNIIY